MLQCITICSTTTAKNAPQNWGELCISFPPLYCAFVENIGQEKLSLSCLTSSCIFVQTCYNTNVLTQSLEKLNDYRIKCRIFKLYLIVFRWIGWYLVWSLLRVSAMDWQEGIRNEAIKEYLLKSDRKVSLMEQQYSIEKQLVILYGATL